MKPDETPPDPLPSMIAGIDQAVEMFPQFARYAWELFDALRVEGFDEDQALVLARDQIGRALGE